MFVLLHFFLIFATSPLLAGLLPTHPPLLEGQKWIPSQSVAFPTLARATATASAQRRAMARFVFASTSLVDSWLRRGGWGCFHFSCLEVSEKK